MENERVGIFGKSMINWAGGRDMMYAMLSGLATQVEDPKNQIFLFIPFIIRKFPKDFWECLKKFSLLKALIRGVFYYRSVVRDIIRLHLTIREIKRQVGQSCTIVIYKDISRSDEVICPWLIKSLSKRKIDRVISLFHPLPHNFPLPWAGYIADLQFKLRPQHYSKETTRVLTKITDGMVLSGKPILTASIFTKDEIKQFYPDVSVNLISLPLTSVLSPSYSNVNSSVPHILHKYQLKKPFFLVSNSFNIHDDHLTAFLAFDEARKKLPNHDFELVCTGETKDAENPSYFADLMIKASKLAAFADIKILGFIPKDDLLALMLSARALVQPTLYEGCIGGGAVYSAVSLGTPVILSDIPVNLLLESYSNVDVAFFITQNHHSLAHRMVENLLKGAIERKNYKQLQEQSDSFARNLGQTIYDAIRL